MPAKPLLPVDDLYARLEVPLDASSETIEVAWRALLKRHHPDVAGGTPDADDRAKRINVAHDWLSDPELRARYDRERVVSRARAAAPNASGRRSSDLARHPARPRPQRTIRQPADAAERLARHLDRVAGLTPDEIDRMALADPPPIAFVASIARFLPPARLAQVEAAEARVGERLPRAVRWNAGIRDPAVGFAHEILLAPFLDEHLSPPFRERVHERLTRGWSAAVDQPRYGPNTAAVGAAIDRLRRIPADELRRITTAAASSGGARRGSPPWPSGLRPDEDDALRVSSDLARKDAAAALAVPIPPAARTSLDRAVHALVLRHGFSTPTFVSLVGPGRVPLGIDAPRSGVRQGRPPRG